MLGYHRRYGHHPAVVCADQMYLTCSNRAFWLRHGIRLSGQRLGRPKRDPDLVAKEKRQLHDDQRRRNAVEGRFGQGKRRYGLGLSLEKIALTQGSTIAMNILVMNLKKLLVVLFVLFTCWLHLLWARGSMNNAHSAPSAEFGAMA
jgi:IS5 family transposase